jgi:hypothetical protein
VCGGKRGRSGEYLTLKGKFWEWFFLGRGAGFDKIPHGIGRLPTDGKEKKKQKSHKKKGCINKQFWTNR